MKEEDGQQPSVSPNDFGFANTPDHFRVTGLLGSQSLAFLCVCVYVLSQIYMVPVLIIGPSWPVWPTLPDLAVVSLACVIPFVKRGCGQVRPPLAVVKRYLIIALAYCITSFCLLTLNAAGMKAFGVLNEKGQNVGLFQIYRMLQYMAVFWLSSSIEFHHRRRAILRGVVLVAFCVCSAGLVANYFDWYDTASLAPHISRDIRISGPWSFYSRGIIGRPVGTMSYHHAYPCLHILLLGALYLQLCPGRNVSMNGLVLFVTAFCALVSRSRAGFLAMCVYVLLGARQKPLQLALTAITMCVVAIGSLGLTGQFRDLFVDSVERQRSIVYAYAEDGFAGRVDIWTDRIELLSARPLAWVFGMGFGSAVETGSNAHMMYLHLILELGIIGFIGFSVFMYRVCKALKGLKDCNRSLLYAIVALLVSGFSQETFYPVPALGHLGGLCLLAISVALGENCEDEPLNRRE